MIFIFYFFAVVLTYFSFKSYLGGISYLKYTRSELAKPPSSFRPFVSIIAPCKGDDQGLTENLASLFEVDYPEYEVIFVVDDQNDPAVSRIRPLLERISPKSKLVIASKASGSSQKVENIREGILHARDDSKIFVFADSDVRPPTNWLRSLLAPLQTENVGASTGYRWFIAEEPSLATELRSAWNASIASALGPNVRSNFCWGGSMAIRREVFERLKIREGLHGTVSDDFVITRILKSAGMDIYFVPQALTPSIENCSLGGLLEFTNRQMKITRVYASHLWLMSYFGSAVFNLTLIWAVVIMITRPNAVAFLSAAATVVLVSVFSIGKSYLRWRAVKLILTDYSGQMSRQFWTQNTLWLATPAIFLYNCISATLSRKIRWRGTVYEMVSSSETRLPNDPNI